MSGGMWERSDIFTHQENANSTHDDMHFPVTRLSEIRQTERPGEGKHRKHLEFGYIADDIITLCNPFKPGPKAEPATTR